jgi:hypothetical protein
MGGEGWGGGGRDVAVEPETQRMGQEGPQLRESICGSPSHLSNLGKQHLGGLLNADCRALCPGICISNKLQLMLVWGPLGTTISSFHIRSFHM